MNYLETKKFLDSLHLKMKDFNTRKTKALLKRAKINLTNPIIIHVAGTNGKGSVCAMIEAVLLEAGCSVGLNTSPHLIELTERIRVNGKNISRKEFAKNLTELLPAISSFKKPVSYFEALTVLAAKIFMEKKPDFVIFEAGMGGRLDATNAFDSRIQIITDISLEHTDSLGNSIGKIAEEKAGIIKEKGIVAVRKDNTGYKTIRKKIIEKNAAEINPGKEIEKKIISGELKTNLSGKFQERNLSLAVAAVYALRKKGIKIADSAIKKGLTKVNWPARMQIVKKNPLIVIDGAHNPAGVRALFESINEFEFNKLIVVFGALKDKNFAEMVSLLEADELILAKPESERAIEPKKLIKFVKKNKKIRKFRVIPLIPKAIVLAEEIALKNDLILACGSLYMAGKALKTLKAL